VTIGQIALFGMLGALTFAAKVAMSILPNIEPVSLFVMLFAVVFGRKSLYPIGLYVAMEILVYGIQLWMILAGAAWLCRNCKSPLSWALLCGGFGLAFGALCAPVYLFIGGPGYAISWWASGIPFDLLHCAGNFVMALLLFVPLRRLLEKLYAPFRRK